MNSESVAVAPRALTTLSIAHFNDVYQVSDQEVRFEGKETINAAKFATLLQDIRTKWGDRSDGGKDGLVGFSGDLFSPSVESSTTRGGHLPAIMNGLDVDVSCVGNHEFDFGFLQMTKLIKQTKFPWLLSNIFDTSKNPKAVPESTKEFHVLEKAGVQIGLIGLVEKDWIATIAGWPATFEHRDMVEAGRDLSSRLRDPAGPYKCDIIIAFTHSRVPNDIKLAKALGALSPSAQATRDIASEQGVDLLLGGHDHIYWVSKGVTSWDGYDLQALLPDANDDRGDVLIIKSGTDFRDLSEITLTLRDTPPGSIRKKVIQEIKGKRHTTRGNTPENQQVKEIIDKEIGLIRIAHAETLFITEVELDVTSSLIRLNESPIGNWIADCIRPAYDEVLVKLGFGKVDGVIAITGDFRSGRVYPRGPVTVGELMAILPYLDPTMVIELDANSLWDALESGLSRYPTREGRFPAISGLRVEWDSSKPGGQRVLGIWLTTESGDIGPNGRPKIVDKEPVLRSNTRKYLIMAGEYIVNGGDGYDVFKGQKQIIDAESGQSKSALIRKFLRGTQILNKRLGEKADSRGTLSSGERAVLSEVEAKIEQLSNSTSASRGGSGSSASKNDAQLLHQLPPSYVYSAAYDIADLGDPGLLDPYERQRARSTIRKQAGGGVSGSRGTVPPSKNDEEAQIDAAEKSARETLPMIHPVVDGRLRDLARS